MLLPTLSITGAADCNMIDQANLTERMVEWIVRAPAAPIIADQRLPLNLALVIDRSGSMSGDKLHFVQLAANYVLDQLNSRDRVAVIAYDDEINVVGESQPAAAAWRAELKRRILQLHPGGSTNLSEGWLRGAGQVADQLQPNGINRVLLLTDGLANKGITAQEELAHHARELRTRGVSTSTFGVGLDFNEHLLEAMAEKGGGNFHFIEHPNQIPNVFRRELGELLTVVARNAALHISGPDTAAVELLGGLAFEYDGAALLVPLGDLFSGEERCLYLRVRVQPGPSGAVLRLRGRVTYLDQSEDEQTAATELLFSYANAEALNTAPQDTDLASRAAEIGLSTVAREALRLQRAGRSSEGAALVASALHAYAPLAAPKTVIEYRELAKQLEDRSMSMLEIKKKHFAEYKKRTSRQ